ncbi:MAG: TrkA C-terminal domain-containing protein, partial [Burkholderiales bacterium]
AKNLVITLSVKSLNPHARVVARCHEVSYVDKIRRVGADAIVSPDYSGAMQIAASMIRPQAASFVDEMLRDQRHIRVEEVAVPPGLAGRALHSLALSSPECLLVAIRNRAGWRFNPDADYSLEGGDTLVVMASASGRSALEARLAA